MNDFYDTVGAAAPRALRSRLLPSRHRVCAARLGQVSGPGRCGSLPASLTTSKSNSGPDLRGTPPIPRRLPLTVHLTIGLLVVWAGVGDGPLDIICPTAGDLYAIQGSYILYLVGMLALMGTAILPALSAGSHFPFMLFNHLFPRLLPGLPSRK